MSDTVIQIEHLSKKYRLGVINTGSLRKDLQSWVALKLGKDDPNTKIDEDKFKGDQEHFWALKDICYDIKHGDRLGIIGKNGAGKSTLLKIISRITAPTEGSVKIKGKVASLLEIGTGFHGELTGRENIYLNGAILGMKKRRINRLLDEIISFSGIEHHIDTPVKRYSSGMYVRLAFAVAAHLDSDILIADEVLAVGDTEFQRKALGKMQDLSTGQGRTVLFVSHNIQAVKSLCNCGIILDNGTAVYKSNNIDDLTSKYQNFNSYLNNTLKWENNNEFTNLKYTPISLELLEEDGSEINSFISADKNYLIKFIFEAHSIDPSLTFVLLFSSLGDDLLFFSSPDDYFNNFAPVIGTNVLYCKIPKHLLNIREYNISLGLAIPYINWFINPYKYDVSIKMNVISKEIINPFGSYPSLMFPELEWNVGDN